MKEGKVLTPQEAADRLKLSLRSVYRLAEEGLLPGKYQAKTIMILVIEEETVKEIEAQLPEGAVKPRQVRKLLLERSKKKYAI